MSLSDFRNWFNRLAAKPTSRVSNEEALFEPLQFLAQRYSGRFHKVGRTGRVRFPEGIYDVDVNIRQSAGKFVIAITAMLPETEFRLWVRQQGDRPDLPYWSTGNVLFDELHRIRTNDQVLTGKIFNQKVQKLFVEWARDVDLSFLGDRLELKRRVRSIEVEGLHEAVNAFLALHRFIASRI